MTETDTERLAFEKWFISSGKPLAYLEKCFNGEDYFFMGTRYAFDGWQARAQDSRCGELLEAAKLALHSMERIDARHDSPIRIKADKLTKAIAAFEESSAALQKQLR